jgi:DNA-binding IscR family transcriptional regulator
VVDAIEGPFRLTLCCSEEHTEASRSCDLESNCRVKGPVRFVHHSLRQFLHQITLADLAFGHRPVTLTLHGESPAPNDGCDASKEVMVAKGS